MTTPPHLQILTTANNDEPTSFAPFPHLSTELRLQIWELSLQRYRLFEVTFEPPAAPPATNDHHGTAEEIRDAPPQQPVIHTWTSLHHPLLHTTRESRAVALAFFRIQIPCLVPLPSPHDDTVASTLYFSPEWDFLFFDIQDSDIHAHAVSSLAMLRDMRAADGKGRGVCNLAMDKKLVLGWAGVENELRGDPNCLEFRRCLEGLKEIIWMTHKEEDDGAEENSPPPWRIWWKILLASWGLELERPSRESVLRGRHLPGWEQELYRLMREERKETAETEEDKGRER